MALLNYQNIAVTVNGASLFANNASFSFEAPIEPIRSLGQQKAIASIVNGPIEGTLNIEYIVSSASDPGKSLFSGIIDKTITSIPVVIGGKTFASGYLTDHSLTAEPNSIINGKLGFKVFGELSDGAMTSSAAGSSTSSTIAHGAYSTAVTDALSFEYSATVEWEPVYYLGSKSPLAVNFQGAQQTLNIKGLNLSTGVVSCQNTTTATVNINATCGNNLFSLPIENALIQNFESSVQAGGFVESNYTLVKNY